jgi:hypothetical protein
MSVKQYTMEEVVANMQAAQERIKPAVLAETKACGLALSAYLTERNLEPTPEHFYQAINALFDSLPWVVPPAKLLARDQNERPAMQQSVEQATKPFTDKVKASEKAEAQAAADKASIEQAKQIIENYRPTKMTVSGRESFDWGEIDAAQQAWKEALDNVISKKGDLQNFAKWLVSDRDRRYAAQERRREKV